MDAAVFLDRDNTLIANDGDLGDPDRVRLVKGVAPALKSLRDAGYQLVVVTNQGGVARGRFTEEDVDRVNQRIATLVDEAAPGRDLIQRFYYCPYHPEASVEEYRRDHPWRKPQPGMLLQAARDLKLDLARCWIVGDQARDVEAGRAAGCRTVLINGDSAVATEVKPTAAVRTFRDAAEAILRSGGPGPDGSRRAAPSSNHGAGRPAPAAGADRAAPPRHETPGPHDRAAAASPTTTTPTTTSTTTSTTIPAAAPVPAPTPAPKEDGTLARLSHAMLELTEELRQDRERRAEFTALRLAAVMCQLLAVLLALLGVLQLGSTDAFLEWMVGAVLVQMLTITILLVDLKG